MTWSAWPSLTLHSSWSCNIIDCVRVTDSSLYDACLRHSFSFCISSSCSILAIYGWHRYYLVYLYMKNKDKAPAAAAGARRVLPRVTIQLPIFNEMYVADRLIDAVCEMDYPRELLEIQVLDDSTDETTSNRRAGGPAPRGTRRSTSATCIASTARATRRARSRRACAQATGEFIAIFDADFIPPKDFLQRTLPYFATDAEDRHGAGALGAYQPGLLAADEDPVDPARRALRARAWRPQPRRLLLQLQRHRGRLAA